MLRQHNAPAVMDYLSLDTEGSELDILKAFPYQDFRFNCITVEHNFQERERAQILRLLEANAYVRGETPFFSRATSPQTCANAQTG